MAAGTPLAQGIPAATRATSGTTWPIVNRTLRPLFETQNSDSRDFRTGMRETKISTHLNAAEKAEEECISGTVSAKTTTQ